MGSDQEVRLLELRLNLLEQQLKTLKLYDHNIILLSVLKKLLNEDKEFVLKHVSNDELSEICKPIN